MIARFRPTYFYKDLLSAYLDRGDWSRLKKKLEDLYRTKDIFFFSQARVALFVLLNSLNKQGGVISPAYNSISVADAVKSVGMVNQFADISLNDYNMYPKSVEKVVDKTTKVLIATHQFGIPCDILALKKIALKYGLVLIEDAADALGAKINGKLAGTFGVASIISFENTKVISGFKGGCLLVYDKKLTEKIKKVKLENNGDNSLAFLKSLAIKFLTNDSAYNLFFPLWTTILGKTTQDESSQQKFTVGYLSKISPFSASLVLKQIGRLDQNIQRRQEIAKAYLSGLAGQKNVQLPKVKTGSSPSWVRFPFRVKKKQKFFEKIVKKGVDLTWTFSYVVDQAPNARLAAEEVLGLPIYPSLTDDEISKAITVIKKS